MARKWTRWMHKQSLRPNVLPLVIVISTVVKWCVGLGSYSGACAGISVLRALTHHIKGKRLPLFLETMKRNAIGWK